MNYNGINRSRFGIQVHLWWYYTALNTSNQSTKADSSVSYKSNFGTTNLHYMRPKQFDWSASVQSNSLACLTLAVIHTQFRLQIQYNLGSTRPMRDGRLLAIGVYRLRLHYSVGHSVSLLEMSILLALCFWVSCSIVPVNLQDFV